MMTTAVSAKTFVETTPATTTKTVKVVLVTVVAVLSLSANHIVAMSPVVEKNLARLVLVTAALVL
jgi:hypothetical protein